MIIVEGDILLIKKNGSIIADLSRIEVLRITTSCICFAQLNPNPDEKLKINYQWMELTTFHNLYIVVETMKSDIKDDRGDKLEKILNDPKTKEINSRRNTVFFLKCLSTFAIGVCLMLGLLIYFK